MTEETSVDRAPVDVVVMSSFLRELVAFTAERECSREWLPAVVELANANPRFVLRGRRRWHGIPQSRF